MASEPRQQEPANVSRSSNYLIGLEAGDFDGNQITFPTLPGDRTLKAEHFKAWKHDRQAKVNGNPSSDSTQSLLLSTGKSFLIGADSEPSASPTSTVASATDSFVAKSNISVSNCSSRHHPSASTVTPEINMPATASEQDPTKTNLQKKPAEKANQTQHSKKHKNAPKNNARNTSSKALHNNTTEGDCAVAPPNGDNHGQNEGRLHGDNVYGGRSKKSNQQKKKSEDLVEGLSHKATLEKPAKHTKSTANLRKTNSAVIADQKFETGSQHDRSLANNDGTNEQNRKSGHAKKLSTLSGTSSSSRKSDAKGSRAIGDSNGSSSKTNTPRKSKSADSLLTGASINNLEVGNLSSWPALGPSTSPQSSIADGKRPPPIYPSINTARPAASRMPTRPASANGVVIPAVPNISRKPRPQS